MAKGNKSKYAVLGVLSCGAGSGYDVKKFMERSTGNFWHESYGQIYPILKQLLEEGLATCHTEKQEGKPERLIYTLTTQGMEELRNWLVEPVEESVERNELLLKLLFGSNLSPHQNIRHVRTFQALQAQLLKKYEGIEQGLMAECDNDPAYLYSLITVRYGVHRCRSILTWCNETISMLENMAD